MIYAGSNDASNVPAEWHGWLHRSIEGVPESDLPPDPAFEAVKYRDAFKSAVRHIHLAPQGELGPFLFDPRRGVPYSTPILSSWWRAHYEQSAIYELPYTVAEGFAAKHGVGREAFLERIAPRLVAMIRR